MPLLVDKLDRRNVSRPFPADYKRERFPRGGHRPEKGGSKTLSAAALDLGGVHDDAFDVRIDIK